MTDQERDDAYRVLNETVVRLTEHFDCIQILASVENKDGSTDYVPAGLGNYYTRRGLATQFLSDEVAKDVQFKLEEEDEE